MNDIPEEILKWVKGIIEENLKAAKGPAREKILHKERHTGKVVKAGEEIVKNSPEYKWNVRQAAVICFLHDIGRFPQVLSNSYSDIRTGIDHAGLGVKMIAQQDFPWEKWGLRREEIIEAIKWHNQKEYPGDSLYAKFIRDADKNALFWDFEIMRENALEEEKNGNEIKEAVWKCFESRKAIGKELIKSNSEWDLNVASWLWDLNLSYSRKMAVKSGVIEKIVEVLVKNGNSEIEVERAKKDLEEFRLFATTV